MENKFTAHESAYIDEGCVIGNGTKIWHFSHVMSNCTIGENCNIGQNVVVTYGTGSTTTGQSAMTTSGSPANTAANTLKIVGLFDEPENVLGAYAKLVVKINHHSYSSGGVAGV